MAWVRKQAHTIRLAINFEVLHVWYSIVAFAHNIRLRLVDVHATVAKQKYVPAMSVR